MMMLFQWKHRQIKLSFCFSINVNKIIGNIFSSINSSYHLQTDVLDNVFPVDEYDFFLDKIFLIFTNENILCTGKSNRVQL